MFIWSKVQLTEVPTCMQIPQSTSISATTWLKHLSWKTADQILGHSPKSRRVTCLCPMVWWPAERFYLPAPYSLTCFTWSTPVMGPRHVSYKCIQLSLENIKRWQILNFCKQLVPLSGKNVILIANRIPLDLLSRKVFIYFFFSDKLKKFFVSFIFYLQTYTHSAIRPLFITQ